MAVFQFMTWRDLCSRHTYRDGEEITGPHYSYLWKDNETGEQKPYWLRKTHQGLVLWEREANGYDDSDFYACWWNEEKGCISETMFGSTRGWTYLNGCTVDADEETRAKAEAFRERREAERRRAEWEREQATPRKGRIVRVHTGHNRIPVGTEGRIFWTGKSKYPPYGQRIGFKDSTGHKWWADANKVEVTSPI